MAFNEGGMASGLLIIAVSIVFAAGFGSGSLVLFGLVGLVAGPNLKNFDPDA